VQHYEARQRTLERFKRVKGPAPQAV
jgi:hypothetical protein